MLTPKFRSPLRLCLRILNTYFPRRVFILIVIVLCQTVTSVAQQDLAQRSMDVGDSLLRKNKYEEALVVFVKAQTEYGKSNNTSKVLSALDGERVCYECMNEFEKALSVARQINDIVQGSNVRFTNHLSTAIKPLRELG